jgi:capsular polysaccharide export protein
VNSANVVTLRPKSDVSSSKKQMKVLLLQGPIGPFFRILQQKFISDGIDAWRVNFNAADRLHSGRKNTLNFKSAPSEYEGWLANLLQTMDIRAVILFGTTKSIHVTAREVCTRMNIPVISLEEGYIRPGLVTVESYGNNSESPIAGKLPRRGAIARALPSQNHASSSLNVMGRYATFYYICHGLFSSKNEKSLFHKPDRTRLVSEFFCWIRNGVRKFTNQHHNSHVMEKLLEMYDRQFFLVPFQVSDDGQLSSNASNGWSNETLAMNVIESFAKTCPAKFRLVFKIHPLERGHSTLPSLVARLAHVHGVSDRIDIMDSGSLGLLTKHSAGMITINSTAGLSAIFHGVPLAVLGLALYRHPSLATIVTDASDIDQFWTTKHIASATLRRNYLAWLRAECLVVGDYYLEDIIEETAARVVDRSKEIIDAFKLEKSNSTPLSFISRISNNV